MIELVYMSQAQSLFYDDELEELLRISWKNNAIKGITGMLLYDGYGTFIQAIEGERAQIDELFAVISKDPRHGDIQKLSYQEIKKRNFAEWKMGFKKLDDTDADKIQGYSAFMSTREDKSLAGKKGFAVDMLNHFKRNISA